MMENIRKPTYRQQCRKKVGYEERRAPGPLRSNSRLHIWASVGSGSVVYAELAATSPHVLRNDARLDYDEGRIYERGGEEKIRGPPVAYLLSCWTSDGDGDDDVAVDVDGADAAAFACSFSAFRRK